MKLPVVQGLVQSGQLIVQKRVCFVALHRDRCAYLIARNMRAYLNRAEQLGLHGDIHFRLASFRDEMCSLGYVTLQIFSTVPRLQSS
jgi:hypothetical protein